jgi:hypothetical protein
MKPALSIGIASSLALAVAAGCSPGAGPARPLVANQEVVVTGAVVSIDVSPWTYDGDALVVVASAAHGAVSVHLPARWNLCKARQPDALATLQPGDRVVAEGTTTGPADLTVCAETGHRLQRMP